MEAIEGGDATCSMNDEVRVKTGGRAVGVDADLEPGGGGLDGGDVGVSVDVDAGLLGAGGQQLHQVGVELAQGSRAVVDDRALRAGAGGDVRELERDEAAADEHDPLR